jgi:hypothetical protein
MESTDSQCFPRKSLAWHAVCIVLGQERVVPNLGLGATGPISRQTRPTVKKKLSSFVDGEDIGESRLTQAGDLVENDLNLRLIELRNDVNELSSAPYQVWIENTSGGSGRVEDLRVKIKAARWMLRIAKHLHGATRELVISTLQRSLDDLESVVASEMRAKEAARAA